MASGLVCVITLMMILSAIDGPGVEVQDPGTDTGPMLPDSTPTTEISEYLSHLEGHFTENLGQMEEGAGRFYARGNGYSVALGVGWVSYNIHDSSGTGLIIKVTFPGSEPVPPSGEDVLDLRSNFFLGDNPEGWQVAARSYRQVVYRELYPSIDLVYYIDEGGLKYDFIVRPGGDPSVASIAFEGLDSLDMDQTTGDLLLGTSVGTLRECAPFSYQDRDGERTQIPCQYEIKDDDRVAYRVSSYDPDLPLVIDPKLTYSTLIGGSTYDEHGYIALGPDGSIYVTGTARSTNFPTTSGAYDTSYNSVGGWEDVVILKLASDGKKLLYSTYLGGWKDERPTDIEVDKNGCAVVGGRTGSNDFPTYRSAFGMSYKGDWEGFLVKLNSTGGALISCSIITSNVWDQIMGVELDVNDSIYITGVTGNSAYPTTSGAYRRTFSGNEAFLTKLNANGTDIIFSTFLGGSRYEVATQMFLDEGMCATLIGHTDSTDFPTTTGAHNRSLNVTDMFISKFSSDGSKLLASTFIGAGGDDKESDIYSVFVDRSGCVYVTGMTERPDFPTTPGVVDRHYDPWAEGFVVKFSANLTKMIYSTFFGGTNAEVGYKILGLDDGSVWVAGSAPSGNFPLTNDAWDKTGDDSEAFLLRLNANASEFLYSTYIGGDYFESAFDMVIDNQSRILLAGHTGSKDWVTTTGAYDTTFNGVYDIFVIRTSESIEPWFHNVTAPSFATTGDPLTLNATIEDNKLIMSVNLEHWSDNSSNITESVMDFVSGSNRKGTWDHTMMANSTSLAPITFRVTAWDPNMNANSSQWRTIPVFDNDLPEVEDTTAPLPTTGDGFNFTIDAMDNIGIENVTLSYWFADATSSATNVTLNISKPSASGNGIYFHDGLTIPAHSLDALNYQVTVQDTSNNTVLMDIVHLNITDNDTPVIHDVTSTAEATTGDPFRLEVNLSDNIGVSQVHVVYWFGSDQTGSRNVSLKGIAVHGLGNGTYVMNNLTVPMYSIKPLHYRFAVRDTWGNWLVTLLFVEIVRDDDDPLLEGMAAPQEATTGEPFSVSIDVADNLGITTVMLVYWFGEDPTSRTNIQMDGTDLDPRGNGTYSDTRLVVPTDALGPLFFYIQAEDAQENFVLTRETWVHVRDNDPVYIFPVTVHEILTTGEPCSFNCTVIDNIEVTMVRVICWWGQASDEGNATVNLTMWPVNVTENGNGDYLLQHAFNTPMDSVADLNYIFWAIDGTGNTKRSEVLSIPVVDDDSPVIVEDTSPGTATTGDIYTFRVNVSDNIGIMEAQVDHWFGDGSVQSETMEGLDVHDRGTGTYGYDLLVQPDMTEPLHYRFHITDLSGLVLAGQVRDVPVQDDDPPSLRLGQVPTRSIKGADLVLSTVITDNLGIRRVEFLYIIGEDEPQVMVVEGVGAYQIVLFVPRTAEGNVVGHITAEDLSGNNASTEKLTIEIYNPPPEMEGLGSIRVTEGEDLVLDLRDHLSDANDPLTDLTVRCDNENFMVDGLVLTIHYDIWVPSHGVQLLISDGEDVTVVDLQVKVTNTNGPPEVPHITSPKKNSTWTVGDKITFEGEYGDPDLQEGQILVIVWKSDISGEIARFNNVEATPFSVNDLEVGDHVITVTVSDGEFETSSSIELTVEPRTIMGLPVTIFAILVAVIVAVFVAFLVLRMRGGSSEQEGSRSPFQRRG